MDWRLPAVPMLILPFVIVPAASASLMLNEISPRTSPEWIEFYNSGPDAVDLTGWYLVDKQNHNKPILAPEPIAPNTYYVFSGVNSWLNNDDEESVTLYNSVGEVIDAVVFPKTVEGTTVARQPDITGSWLTNQPPTQGYTNTVASPSPSPSLSPSPSPSVTPSYSPAFAAIPPSPSPSPTPPSVSPSPTLTPSVVYPSPSKLVVSTTQPTLASPDTGTVSGASTIDLSGFGLVSPIPQESPQLSSAAASLSLNRSRAKVLLTTGSGLVLISLATYLWYRKKMGGIIT